MGGAFMLLSPASFAAPIYCRSAYACVKEGNRIAHTIFLPPKPDEGRVKHVFRIGVAGNPLAREQNQPGSLFAEPCCRIVDRFQIVVPSTYIDTVHDVIDWLYQETIPSRGRGYHKFGDRRCRACRSDLLWSGVLLCSCPTAGISAWRRSHQGPGMQLINPGEEFGGATIGTRLPETLNWQQRFANCRMCLQWQKKTAADHFSQRLS